VISGQLFSPFRPMACGYAIGVAADARRYYYVQSAKNHKKRQKKIEKHLCQALAEGSSDSSVKDC
jgi:hypothetical protein